MAGNDYCVKGTVSEQTIHTLQEGMDVRILSRVNSDKWAGYIYKINTEKAKQTNRYYYGDQGDQASKYEFFVAMDSNEGLLMGQHVYIELGADTDDEPEGLWLPLYYVVEDEGAPFVYAADDQGRIEKRRVVLGTRDEGMDTVLILEGLSYFDRIAFPDETVQVGMAVSETSYVPEGEDGPSESNWGSDGPTAMDEGEGAGKIEGGNPGSKLDSLMRPNGGAGEDEDIESAGPYAGGPLG